MNHPALRTAAAILLMLSIGTSLAQSPLPTAPITLALPKQPAPEAFFPARLLLSHKAADSPDAGGLLVETLARIAELTQKGKSIGDAMRIVFGPLANNDWLRTCVLTNWRVANDFGLVTPDNLQRMQAGEMPAATVGTYAGKAMAVISAPDGTAPGVTYRLVPAPLQKAMTEQAQMQAAADRTAAYYAENRRIAEQREIAQHSVRAAATPPPPAPPTQAQLQAGWWPSYPKNRWTPGPDPKLQGGANNSALQNPIFIDVKIGEAAKLDTILHTSNHLFLNKVDHVTGIDYGVVDPSKTMRDDPGATIDYVPIITYHTNAVYYHAAWANDTIPGTTEKGAYLCTIGPARYYLDAFEPGQNSYRIIVCLFPLPSTAQTPPPPTQDTERYRGPK